MAVDLRKLKDRAAELAARGKLEKAADLFREALDADARDVATRQKLADVLRRAGRIDDAIDEYRQVADLYGRDGLLIKAIAISKIVLELDPDHVDTQTALADLYARKARTEGARPSTRHPLVPAAAPAAPGGPPAAAQAQPPADSGDRLVELPLRPAIPPPSGAIPLDAGPSAATHAASEEGWAGGLPFDPSAVSLEAEPTAAGADAEAVEITVEEAEGAPAREASPSAQTPLEAIVSAAGGAVEEEVVIEAEPLEEGAGSAADEPLDPYVAPGSEAPVPSAQVPATPATGAPGSAEPAAVPALPRVPIFSDLSRDAFVALTTAMALRRVGPGEAVVGEGEAGTSFYVIATGRLAVSKRNEQGDEVVLAHLGEGDFFGEMALLSGAARSATVSAEEPSEVLEFSADVLTAIARKHPHLATSLRRFYRHRLLANAMAVSPLFRPFGRDDRKAVMERFRTRDVRAGEVVVREGEPSDGLYVVLEGAVDVLKWGEAGNVLVARLREGDLFGEMSCLRKTPASASVVIARAGTLLRLPRREFDEIIVTHPQVLELVSELSEERSESLDAIVSGRAEWSEDGLVLV